MTVVSFPNVSSQERVQLDCALIEIGALVDVLTLIDEVPPTRGRREWHNAIVLLHGYLAMSIKRATLAVEQLRQP